MPMSILFLYSSPFSLLPKPHSDEKSNFNLTLAETFRFDSLSIKEKNSTPDCFPWWFFLWIRFDNQKVPQAENLNLSEQSFYHEMRWWTWELITAFQVHSGGGWEPLYLSTLSRLDNSLEFRSLMSSAMFEIKKRVRGFILSFILISHIYVICVPLIIL